MQDFGRQIESNSFRRSCIQNSDRQRLDRAQLVEDDFRRRFQRFPLAARTSVGRREPLVHPDARALPDQLHHRVGVLVPGRRQQGDQEGDEVGLHRVEKNEFVVLIWKKKNPVFLVFLE